MDAFKRYLKDKKYLVFLDFEGTQFSHEIIAVGAVKCELKENQQIEEVASYKEYVRPLGAIGRFVENMTKIHESTLREQGVDLETMFKNFGAFIGTRMDECLFIVFGSNDTKMILDSITYSRPGNPQLGYSIVKNTMDYLTFITQYVKDDNGNNYSLTNYLKVFGAEPHGDSHDPLNDAYDLMNVYIAMNEKKDTLLEEYMKVLKKQRQFPAPVKEMLEKLIAGESVTSEEFTESCRKFLD